MGFEQAAQANLPIERRAVMRARVECAARLQTPGGDWHGTLNDISELGARLQVAAPPPAGVLALLSWQSHETFCKIVWATADSCGLRFERPISRSAVAESVAEEIKREGPAAELGNIPVGTRRRRPGTPDAA